MPPSSARSLANRLIYSVGKDPYTATDRDWFYTLAYLVRDRFIDRWMETQRACYREDAKCVYYINRRFLDQVAHHWPGDNDRLRRMSPAACTRGSARY